MPMFEFTCNKCNKTVEKIMSFSESEKVIDCSCGEKGGLEKNKVNAFNVSFKGKWFKNAGSY